MHRVYDVPRLVNGCVLREKLRVPHFTTADRKWAAVKKGEPPLLLLPAQRKKTGNEKPCAHGCAQLTYPHAALTKHIVNLLTQPQVNKVAVRGTK